MPSGNHNVESVIEQPLAAGRRTLWIGFASILLVMVLIGIDVALSFQRTNARNTALMKSFRARDLMLDELRNIMIRSGTMIRDYLSETDEGIASSGRAALEAASRQSAEILDSYVRQDDQLGPEQKKAFAGLSSRVHDYWQSLSPALQWDPVTKKTRGEFYRRDAIGPRRAQVLSLSSEITKLNEQQLDAGEQLIQLEQASLRTRLVVASVLGIAICGTLAVLVTLRIRKLETSAEIQYRRVAQARRELRELAGRLESAQEEERKNLSRELHDEVGQSMSAMLVELARLEAILPQDENVRSRLASFRTQAEISVRSVRDMALLLRPSMLDDLGLVAALKWQGREVSRRTGLRVRVDAEDSSDSLPDSHRTCIYRIVQEALNNCSRHAKAGSVRVILKQVAGALEVSIQDDGAGFDPVSEKGMGLLGMEERVSRLNGAMRVESSKGHGTVLSVHLPVPILEGAATAS